jgi:hypothetical protein
LRPGLASGICGGQSGARAGFLTVLWFPPPIFITPNSPSSHSPRAGTIGQKWPTCRVDPLWTPPPTTRIKRSVCATWSFFNLSFLLCCRTRCKEMQCESPAYGFSLLDIVKTVFEDRLTYGPQHMIRKWNCTDGQMVGK